MAATQKLLRVLAAVAVLAGLAGPVTADPTSTPSGPQPQEISTDALSSALRGLLVESLPATLHESRHNWGNVARVPRGLKWKGQGLKVRPEIQHGYKNDGTWRHVRVSTENVRQNLAFSLYNLERPEPGRLRFDVYLAFDVRVDYHQQNWESGVKLFDGTAEARLRVKLMLRCECSTQVQNTGALLPDITMRLRVVRAHVDYDNFRLEHVAGVGGDAAELLGDAARGILRTVRPSLERDLLDRANAAIVKRGDTRELRLGLGRLLQKPGP